MRCVRPLSNLICPISPETKSKDDSIDEFSCRPCDDGWEKIEDSPIVADQEELRQYRGDMGPKDIVDADEDVTIQAGEPLPEPYVPTAAQVAAHNCTHLPYASWCPHCVAARRANSHHRSQSGACGRAVPFWSVAIARSEIAMIMSSLRYLSAAYTPPEHLWLQYTMPTATDDHTVHNLSAFHQGEWPSEGSL